jgi:serine protease Do
MKRWLLTILIVLLSAGTIANGALLLDSNSGSQDTAAELSALQTRNTSLEASLAEQQSDAAALLAEITALQQQVSQIAAVPVVSGTDFTKLAALIEPSTVYVEVFSRFGGGTGSGTIIRADGYVLTNQHVVDGATSINVTLMTGERFAATLLDSSADMDAAVLKITTTRTDLPAAKMGSSAAVMLGEEIITCGYPLGDELPGPATFNTGIVSAIRNMISSNTDNPNFRMDYIQFDADINPGNSGGGLFNMNGELIGIPSYGFATGINTAVPIDAVKSLIQGALSQ